MVTVAELNCQDDDCPEVETVIAIFETSKPKIQTTLHSSIEGITDDGIEQFCRSAKNTLQHSEASEGASDKTNSFI